MTLAVESLLAYVCVGGGLVVLYKWLIYAVLAFQWVLRICLLFGLVEWWYEMEDQINRGVLMCTFVLITVIVMNVVVERVLIKVSEMLTNLCKLYWNSTDIFESCMVNFFSALYILLIFWVMWWFSGIPYFQMLKTCSDLKFYWDQQAKEAADAACETKLMTWFPTVLTTLLPTKFTTWFSNTFMHSMMGPMCASSILKQFVAQEITVITVMQSVHKVAEFIYEKILY